MLAAAIEDHERKNKSTEESQPEIWHRKPLKVAPSDPPQKLLHYETMFPLLFKSFLVGSFVVKTSLMGESIILSKYRT